MRLVVPPEPEPEACEAQSAEIIDLLDARDTAPASETKRWEGCKHHRVRVHEGDVDLKCRDCGERVAAAWWVLQMSRRWEAAYVNPGRLAADTTKRLERRIVELRAEEARLRSRVSRLRAKDKLGDPS